MLTKDQDFNCIEIKAKINHIKPQNASFIKGQRNNFSEIKNIKSQKNHKTKTKSLKN